MENLVLNFDKFFLHKKGFDKQNHQISSNLKYLLKNDIV